ncbi:transmembrane protein, putative (macronuclear) [Tetrahymena thermophila SB210]|uniref:Transmembrane protein, putative n=1 Tax=Tetrahymena thermophila (strain SB210) TaxID=312017 RepID=I7MJ65_TETTS|nr:transmembrane protein, putative [Tetrahymena thermophila SB210]EAR96004.2 transmembrane protein, putative [Tetrahymena thermophila SB210]|eukprot:XP_001016249.2 transmembrane protein, putative [Tetrahymena thermophila SB210]
MKRHRSIESLSSISSESSESESESGSDNDDSEDQSKKSKNSNQSNDGDSVDNRKKRHHKKRKDRKNHSQKQDQRKKSIKRQQTLRIDVNRQKTITPQDPSLQRQRSKSIDSPQKIEIRPKKRQMTYQNNHLNINKVQNDGTAFQFHPHSQNKILNQQRRLQKAKTININDNYLVYNSGGNSKQETNADIDEDYNLQTNNSNNKTGSQTVIRQRKRSSVVSNISNESNTSQQYLFDKKQQQLGLIVNSNNTHQIPSQALKGQIPNINILSAENEEVDQLKLEKQDLKNQLVEEKKRKSKLELINNSLAKEYDQQNQLLNTINNKLDLKANSNQIISSERNYIRRANDISAFARQTKSKKNSFLYKIVNILNVLNPFKSYYKKINQKIGDSAIIYFEFVTYLIFLHLVIAISYMYFYFDYLINSSQKFDSNYQSFVSYLMSHNYTNNTHVSYTITQILSILKILSVTTHSQQLNKSEHRFFYQPIF